MQNNILKTHHFPHPAVITLFLLLLQACASFDLQYSEEDNFIKVREVKPAGKITHTMFLIGDAGNAAPGSVPPALKLLNDKLKAFPNPKEGTVVFLGDNLYPNGFAPKRAVAEREVDEYKMKAQLDAVKDFQGKIFFIAGNHDWYNWGIEGLKRQRNFVEDYLGRKDVLLPKPGCGDPVTIDLTDNLVLILLDSEWWLEDWRGHTEINDGCEVKSRKSFQLLFEEAIKSNRDKNIVIALHHPLYTYGSHGGQFTANDHFFPLAAVRKKLRVPLPGIGSVYPFMRSAIGSRQDLAFPEYKSLKKALIDAARKNGNFIFASGHEHTLQYIEQDDQSFIVSGSGSKLSPVRLGNGSKFAYGYYGFAQLDFYDTGAVWLTFWTPEGDDPNGRLIYKKQIKEALPKPVELPRDSFAEYLSEKKEVTKALSEYDFEKGPIWRLLWGEHYRKAYATPLPLNVLDLSKYEGGLKPKKIGGGNQTNSLRLEDKQKREYAIRSLDKDATRTVPFPFNESFVTEIIQDNFSATHPLAALPVAELSKVVGIYHTDPKIYYVPKQPALGRHNEAFGGSMYQLEERPDGDWSAAPNFGNAKDFKSTVDVIDERTKDHDVRIDNQMVIRARMFDLLIGDWDRHDDQWRWAESKKDGKKFYQPIPRDRDQAFSKYDGLLVRIIRDFTPGTRHFQPYKPNIKKIQWTSYDARYFDPTFLTVLEWKHWEPEVRLLQTKLTDTIIEKAFRETFPPAIFALDAEYIIKTMKTRRDDLMSIARRHYEFINRKVDVVGTEKREYFDIVRINNDSTRVTVFGMNKEGDRKDTLYKRTFLNDETYEIRIYGLDDDDVFNVTGTTDKSPLIRLTGGLGKDVFYDQSNVRTQGKRTIVYDAEDEENKLNVGSETKQRISDDPVMNTYNRKAPDYEFDYAFRTPYVNVNPDDGLLLGVQGQLVTYGFKKSPYSTKNSLSLRYALETSGWSLGYNSEFINIFDRWDMQLDAQYNTPLYAINFYGFGNETPDYEQTLPSDSDEEEEIAENYVRVRQRLLQIKPALLRRASNGVSWSVGPMFESIRIARTQGRIVDAIGDDLNPALFNGLEFLGAQAQLNAQSLDNSAFPTRGFGFNIDTGWKLQLDNKEKNFPYLRSSFTVYQRLVTNGQLVLASRVGVAHNFNNDFEFFQGATLGGGVMDNANFRGVRRERFTGQTSFYHNTDFRLKFLQSANRAIPFSMGIFAGFDNGRVWVKDDKSKVWHYAYGGGLFVAPFNIVTVQASFFRSDDNQNRFTLGGGFFF